MTGGVGWGGQRWHIISRYIVKVDFNLDTELKLILKRWLIYMILIKTCEFKIDFKEAIWDALKFTIGCGKLRHQENVHALQTALTPTHVQTHSKQVLLTPCSINTGPWPRREKPGLSVPPLPLPWSFSAARRPALDSLFSPNTLLPTLLLRRPALPGRLAAWLP
jgi:hypothetical protein